MESTSSYKIKAVDVYSSKNGYIFKVALSDSLSVEYYKFMYLPYGRYSSILMADFLFATKGELNVDLMELLQEAVREDIEPNTGFIVFDTEEAERWHSKDGELEDSSEYAERPDTPRDLQLFRKVFLGNRENRSDLHMNSGTKMAFRVDQGRLFIDFKINPAARDISRSLQINKSDLQAQRDFVTKLLIFNTQETALRDISNDGGIDRGAQGERIIDRDLFIDTLRPVAKRASTHNAWNSTDRLLADRDIIRLTRKWSQGLLGRRDIHRLALLWAHGPQSRRDIQQRSAIDRAAILSRRDISKITIVPRESYWAQLRARQYPADLFKSLIKATRDINSKLWFPTEHIYMLRIINQGTNMNDQYTQGIRINDQWKADITSDSSWGLRAIVSSGYLPKSMSKGSRDASAKANVLGEVPKGSRIIFSKLLVTDERSEGYRGNRPLYLPNEEYRGYRRIDHGLYVPSESPIADKNRESKELYVESVEYRASRRGARDAYLPSYTADGSSQMAPRPGHLADEDEFGDHLLFIKQGEFVEQLLGSKEELAKGSELADYFIHGVTDRKLHGEVIDLEFWGKVVREHIGHILEDVIAYKGFFADIIDEMIFGDRLHEGSSWIELAEMFGITLPELPAFITPDFLTGVRDRMNAIIDAELPVGIRPNTSSGLIEVSFETADRVEEKAADLGEEIVAFDLPTPSELHIENPLGYFDPSPSFLDDQPIAFKPINHEATIGDDNPLGAQEAKPSFLGSEVLGHDEPKPSLVNDTIDADLLSKPAEMEEGLEADFDHLRSAAAAEDGPLLAELPRRIALLETGFIFGDRPEDRAGYIADIYFLGVEGTTRYGTVEDSEWEKFATLALRYGIIGEQMFGTDPVRASELLEDMLGRLDLRPSELSGDIIAEKADHYTELISGLLGDKELAHAIIDDYLIAQKQISEGILPEAILGKAELKKSLIEQGSLAQGLMYDYQDDDVLESGSDPEDWEGGLGVPEDYDPHDPFNEYYPWAVDLDRDELDVDDWQRFDTDHNRRGEWSRNRGKKEFTCTGFSENVTGYFRNDFTHEDYVYEVDFKVEDPQDDDAAGVVFRYVDDQNYYMFMVTGGDVDGSLGLLRSMQLFRMVKGTPQLMGPPMSPFTWVQGQWQRLKVSVVGNRIQLWVNGRMQYDFTD